MRAARQGSSMGCSNQKTLLLKVDRNGAEAAGRLVAGGSTESRRAAKHRTGMERRGHLDLEVHAYGIPYLPKVGS